MIVRFLLGAGLGALVGTGLLAIVSLAAPAPGARAANDNGPVTAGTPDAGSMDADVVAEGGDAAAMPVEEETAPDLVASGTEVAEAVGPEAQTGEETPAAVAALEEAGMDVALPQEPAAEPEAGMAAPETTEADAGTQSPAEGTATVTAEAPESPTEAPEAPVPDSLADSDPIAPMAGSEPAAADSPAAMAAPDAETMPAPAEQPAAAPDIATAEAPMPLNAEAGADGVPSQPGSAEAAPTPAQEPALAEAPAAEAMPGLIDMADLPPLTPEEEALLAQIAAEGPGSALPPDEPTGETVVETEVAPVVPAEKPRDLTERSADGEDANVIAEGGSTLAPAPPLASAAGGETKSGLPQIGSEEAPAGAAPDAAPAATTDNRPIATYARAFENPENKPVYAIVLIDDGAAETDRAALAALPFPVTFALDPTDPKAAEYAAIYRDAGQEVAMLASALPKGGNATDVEVALSVMTDALPETVAIMDMPQRAFQSDRPVAGLVVPAIGAGGRGVLTWGTGLNAADQVARREHVPAAVAFRDLDADGETTPVIRRYLDRAAFKAAQDGRVTVVGRTRPETVAALLEWALEGRSATVALAPLSAVMTSD